MTGHTPAPELGTPSGTPSGAPKPISSFSVLASRITWTLLGPIGLLFATAAIIMHGTGWLTGIDLTFGVLVGLILLSRRVEHRSGSATTLEGEPATEEQYRRFIWVFPVVAVVLWIAANVVGNHVLSR